MYINTPDENRRQLLLLTFVKVLIYFSLSFVVSYTGQFKR